jgi:YggT family protein
MRASVPGGLPWRRGKVKPSLASRPLLRPLPFLGLRVTCLPSLVHEAQMISLYQILMLLLDVVYFIVIAHVIVSWLINFQVLNLRQPLVAQVWDGLNRLLEPVYSRVRRVLPPISGIDLAPLVVLLGVIALRIILRNNAAAFA